MTFKPIPTFVLLAAMAAVAIPALAQDDMPPPDNDHTPWIESEAPPPPNVDLDHLIPLEVGPASNLHYGIDPASLLITNDGLVRYVVVARSNSGTTNLLYDAIRCATNEIKTYARNNADGSWRMLDQPEWRPIDGRLSAAYAAELTQSGMCIGPAVNGPVPHMIQSLKRGGLPAQQS